MPKAALSVIRSARERIRVQAFGAMDTFDAMPARSFLPRLELIRGALVRCRKNPRSA
jgi:hypothetical protein